VTRADEVAARTFDQVYLTVSSPALAGPWLGELIAATGAATIVALQAGTDDRDRMIAAGASADRLVSGMISLVSYAAPLPGETRFPRPGTAYWFPPLASSPFSGPHERTAAVVAALRAGKLPAKRHANVPRAVAFPTAVLMPYLIALETAGWSFRAFGQGDAIRLGARGARAALAVVAASEGRVPLHARVLARPGVLRLGLWLGRRAMPLSLEVYLKEHFTKVHDQTIEYMAGYIAKGKRARGVSRQGRAAARFAARVRLGDPDDLIVSYRST
jgi:2-dehydropantoate 2-reductase